MSVIEHADVVDQDVELATAPNHLVRERRVCRHPPEIELQRDDARPAFVPERCQRRFRPADGEHGRTSLRGTERNALADAARGAGDQPRLPLE